MGKNRKPRNGVDHVKTCSDIELENPNQEIPQDFLTSDDFCIVQKKRGNKKISENQSSNLFRSLSNLKKNVCEEGGKCHLDFWTCKFNGTAKASNTAAESNLCCSDVELQIPTLNSAINLVNGVDTNDSVKELNATTVTVVNDKLSFECKKEFSDSIPVKNVLEIKSSFEENGVTQSNVCCTKKKNRKKDNKKNAIDIEVEELMKKFELEEKTEKKSKSVILSSFVGPEKDSRNLKSTDNSACLNNNVESGISKVEAELKVESDSFDLKEIVSVSDTKGFEQAQETDGLKTIKEEHMSKSSQKRKDKKAKTKSNIPERASLKDASSSEITSNDESNVKENTNVNNASNVSKEDRFSKSKNCNESEKKNKKRPGKKQLAIIHEALRKAKEEEERLKKEEEAKQKIAEEAEKMRLEKLRLEQERKERKKLKEKQRREKMKAEGRLLSKSQKQSRARMVATLAALKQQGIEVPEIGEKKPQNSHGPRLGNCKNFTRKRLDSCQSTQSSDSAIVLSERQKSESFSSQESSGKESLSDLPSSFESTDEAGLMVDSDKGNYSCSEESDGIEDITSCDNSKSKKITNTKILEKQKHNKAEIVPCSQVQLKESCQTVNPVKYRSPVVCVLGHVDTGKTKILDYIRKTHIQDSEAGGITQQIGATMIPQDALKEKCKMVKSFSLFNFKIPGLLVIDTPGHESFSNLRSRGSSICDIAVLVVDIMHGLEPQTLESINLLKKGKTPFVVALNKVDRIYGWKSGKDEDIESVIQRQAQTTQMEFKRRCQEIILQFANQCLNAALFYENNDPRSYVSMVPTSAITGDGMGNLLSTVTELTQSLMHKKLIYNYKLEATVLEVKAIPGLGTTIDVILVNGRLQEGDTIVLAGQDGPIVTQIRSLLMPQPLKELRVKNPYIEYKSIEGAQGVKVTGRDLDKSIAGLPLLVAPNNSVIDALKEEINLLFRDTISSIKTSERGVYVQASTLGSLEALLEFLSSSGVPYFNVKIGPVVKKDVMKASIMLEHDVMYAAILAFDVKIERDAQELADSLGVHIFHADIIYHLFDMYVKYRDDLLLKQQEDIRRLAVYPCKLKVLPEFVFNPRDPIILGVLVEQGSLREGTPLCVPSRDGLEIGTVTSIELNNNKVNCAKKGEEVCIKIDPKPGESHKTYGKHFTHEDLLVSRISRQSIDVIKEHFRNDLQSSDWHLVVELKKILHIV